MKLIITLLFLILGALSYGQNDAETTLTMADLYGADLRDMGFSDLTDEDMNTLFTPVRKIRLGVIKKNLTIEEWDRFVELYTDMIVYLGYTPEEAERWALRISIREHEGGH